jgi:uncharacterized protein with PIN domain
MGNTAFFRFHGELEDFLVPHRRKQTLAYHFRGHPGIKDPIETFGIPHSEVAMIEVDGKAAGYKYQLQPNDCVEVYPLACAGAYGTGQKLFNGDPRFVVDTNLGKLARWLRLLGFDTCWQNNYADSEVVRLGVEEERIILTRDRRLLFHKVIVHGFWVRAVIPMAQIQEVMQRIGLVHHIHPFHRCLECNGLIHPVAKSAVINKLEPLTRKYYDEFFQCKCCSQIYWKGSHYLNLVQKLDQLKNHA